MTSIAIQLQERPHEVRKLQIAFVAFAAATVIALLSFAAGQLQGAAGAGQEILKGEQSEHSVECDTMLPAGAPDGQAVDVPDLSCILVSSVDSDPMGASQETRPMLEISGGMPDDPMNNTFAKIETIIWANLV